MTFHHISQDKDDPSLMKCNQKGCTKKNLRSAFQYGAKHLCRKHWLELKKTMERKMI